MGMADIFSPPKPPPVGVMHYEGTTRMQAPTGYYTTKEELIQSGSRSGVWVQEFTPTVYAQEIAQQRIDIAKKEAEAAQPTTPPTETHTPQPVVPIVGAKPTYEELGGVPSSPFGGGKTGSAGASRGEPITPMEKLIASGKPAQALEEAGFVGQFGYSPIGKWRLFGEAVEHGLGSEEYKTAQIKEVAKEMLAREERGGADLSAPELLWKSYEESPATHMGVNLALATGGGAALTAATSTIGAAAVAKGGLVLSAFKGGQLALAGTGVVLGGARVVTTEMEAARMKEAGEPSGAILGMRATQYGSLIAEAGGAYAGATTTARYMAGTTGKTMVKEVARFAPEQTTIRQSPDYPELSGISAERVDITRTVTYPLSRAQVAANKFGVGIQPKVSTQTFTGQFEGYALTSQQGIPKSAIVGKMTTTIDGKTTETPYIGARALTYETSPVKVATGEQTKYGFIESGITKGAVGKQGSGTMIKIGTLESTEPLVTETRYTFIEGASGQRGKIPFVEKRLGGFKVVQEPKEELTFEFTPTAKPPPATPEEISFAKQFPKSEIGQRLAAQAYPEPPSVSATVKPTTYTPPIGTAAKSSLGQIGGALSKTVNVPAYSATSYRAGLILPSTISRITARESTKTVTTNVLVEGTAERLRPIVETQPKTTPKYVPKIAPVETTATSTALIPKTTSKTITQQVTSSVTRTVLGTTATISLLPSARATTPTGYYTSPSNQRPSITPRLSFKGGRKKASKSLYLGKGKTMYGIFSEAISKFKYGKASMGKGVKEKGFYTPTAETARAGISPGKFYERGGFIGQRGKGEVRIMKGFGRFK